MSSRSDIVYIVQINEELRKEKGLLFFGVYRTKPATVRRRQLYQLRDCEATKSFDICQVTIFRNSLDFSLSEFLSQISELDNGDPFTKIPTPGQTHF